MGSWDPRSPYQGELLARCPLHGPLPSRSAARLSEAEGPVGEQWPGVGPAGRGGRAARGRGGVDPRLAVAPARPQRPAQGPGEEVRALRINVYQSEPGRKDTSLSPRGGLFFVSPGVEELMCIAKWGTGLRPQESPLAQTGRAGPLQVWRYFSFLWMG